MRFNQQGTTLIDMLVYLALLSLVIVFITRVFVSVTKYQSTIHKDQYLQQDSDRILQRFKYDMQRADTITTPASAGQTGSTLTMTMDAQTIAYQFINNTLQVTTPQGSAVLDSSETTVTNGQFIRKTQTGDKPAIQITFTLAARTSAQTKTYTTLVSTR